MYRLMNEIRVYFESNTLSRFKALLQFKLLGLVFNMTQALYTFTVVLDPNASQDAKVHLDPLSLR